MSSKSDPESHDDADKGHDPDGQPEYVFTTIACEYKSGGYRPAGFFCLWDDQLTFVHSKWVQFVTNLPLIGMLLPDAVIPTGPEDRRTRTRIPCADIAQATPYKKGGEDHRPHSQWQGLLLRWRTDQHGVPLGAGLCRDRQGAGSGWLRRHRDGRRPDRARPSNLEPQA
jgi:hypothetical protein